MFVNQVRSKYEITIVEAAYTSTQVKFAIDGVEGIAFYDIDAEDFLTLTTETDRGKQNIKDQAESRNTGEESIIHPFLMVDPNGKIVSHEGRHRCAGALAKGESRFRIVVAAREASWSHKDYGWRWKRQLPMPKVLRGEFRNVTHVVDMNHVEQIPRTVEAACQAVAEAAILVENRSGEPIEVLKNPTSNGLNSLKKEYPMFRFYESIRGLFKNDAVYVWTGNLEHSDAARQLGLGSWPNWMPFYFDPKKVEVQFRISQGVPKKEFLESARKNRILKQLAGDKIFDDRDYSL